VGEGEGRTRGSSDGSGTARVWRPMQGRGAGLAGAPLPAAPNPGNPGPGAPHLCGVSSMNSSRARVE
jgi:hypothetical protein